MGEEEGDLLLAGVVTATVVAATFAVVVDSVANVGCAVVVANTGAVVAGAGPTNDV